MNIPELKWRFTPSVTELFCLFGGSFLVFWYAWIIEDAYVYFRYIDNLVLHGQGLVWNSGEYVEGFSSPIWALLLGGLRVLHLNYWIAVLTIGLFCFVVFWWMGCLVNRGFISSIDGSCRSLNIPLVYLCFTYAVSCYFTSGLESPLVNVVAVGYAAAALWPHSIFLQVLVGLSPLLRHELVIPYLLFIAYSIFVRKCRPYTAIVSFLLSIGGYGLFRIWYYADLFPNTFYLKDSTWINQGLKYVYDTIMPYQTILYMLFMFLAWTALKKTQCKGLLTRERLVMLVLALPIAAYVVKIGGDPRHFRYLAFPFILVVLATGGIAEKFALHFTKCKERLLVLLVGIFGIAVFSNFPRQLQLHPLFRTQYYTHTEFLRINDASYHRFHKAQITPSWRSGCHFLSYAESKKRYAVEFTSKSITDFSPLGEVLMKTSSAGEKAYAGLPLIADLWCQNAYLHAALPVIQNLGLTEPFLARIQMRSNRPAHKFGLIPFAEDILHIRSEYGFVRGAFDVAISEDTKTPVWIVKNIDTIRKIERKVYNEHNFFENIKLAFLPIEKIIPESR
ncbi:MAG: hypothetical protein RQ760_02525 [Sedimentisphaerales bacterium]|nr:hypothetical protein [Sedimentisphaerales bacterium]